MHDNPQAAEQRPPGLNVFMRTVSSRSETDSRNVREHGISPAPKHAPVHETSLTEARRDGRFVPSRCTRLRLMQRVLSRAQVRELDRHAIEVCGVPGLVLMENAGRGAADAIVRALGDRKLPGRRVVVLCGAGNNGGDGYVVARRLAVRGFSVEAVALAGEERLKGDALANYRAWVGIGGRVHVVGASAEELERLLTASDVIVDALFGTGLDREITGMERVAIERANRCSAFRVALDVPSGIDADGGRVLGVAFRADLTITFAAHKRGLLTPSGIEHAGRLVLADIGVPETVAPVGESALWPEPSDVARVLTPRRQSTHKGSAGSVLVLAGSPGKVGAALLVARGALRAGAGLVTIAARPEVVDALETRVLEPMTARLAAARLEAARYPLRAAADVGAVGPGVGLDATARALVERAVFTHQGTVVADADALTHFAGRLEKLRERAGSLVLTPHPGEMARLLETTVQGVETDRYGAVARAVEASSAVVLLKGPCTLVGAPDELPRIGPIGTPALATGGAGDVLTGAIAGLACTLTPFVAAWAGVFAHAMAAEAWSRRTGADRGLLAHEVADLLPHVFAELAAPKRALTD